ncbi:MAG: hypothetical protein ACI9OJ_004913, partial [Myxococcota bacterium]
MIRSNTIRPKNVLLAKATVLAVVVFSLVGCSVEDFLPSGTSQVPDDPPTPPTTIAEPLLTPTVGYPPHYPGATDPIKPPIDNQF